MKCKICNGSLSITDGICVCDYCGSKTTLDEFYENIDVFICYIENDINGRRTKDSIVSYDMYQKLQSKKIDAFYGRVSADGLAGEELEKVCISALTKAKIIVIVGTSKSYFEKLYEKYNLFFENKIIIPVFSDINAGQIPRNISKIQALNYDAIGSDVTLINSILNALGRGDEVNQKELFDKKSNKKMLIVILCCLSLLAGALCYILFGTDLIIKTSEPEVISTVSDVNLDNYNKAVNHTKNNEYKEAIEIFSQLSGYKDSDKQLQLIYDKYAGYYRDSEKGIFFHFKTYSNFGSSIEVDFLVNGNVIKITENTPLTGNNISYSFNDSENNQGIITIILENNIIKLSVKTENKNPEIYIPDQEIIFYIDKKSDKPIINLDVDTIFSWVKNATTIEEVQRMGYEVILEYSSPRMNVDTRYRIKNTDIQLFSVWDTTYISSILAPAELLIPDYIGKPGNKFYINDVLVIPNATGYGNTFIPYGWENDDIITKDTPVLILTKLSFNTTVGGSWIVSFDEFYGEPTTTSSKPEIPTEIKQHTEPTTSTVSFCGKCHTVGIDLNEDGLCEVCADGICFLCGGPDGEGHNCDDYPNVICPNCGWGMFTTGIGNDGITCPDCGTKFI